MPSPLHDFPEEWVLMGLPLLWRGPPGAVSSPGLNFGQKVPLAFSSPTYVPLLMAKRAQPSALLPAPRILAFSAVGCVC